MRSLRPALVLAVAASLAVATGLMEPSPAAARRGRRDRPPTHRVVGGAADLRPSLDAKPLAQLEPGTLVRVVKRAGKEAVRVEIFGSVRMQGIVRREALGLRVVKPTSLAPTLGGRPVPLQVGADVRVVASRGRTLLVETVGVVVRGGCPRSALAPNGPEHLFQPAGGPVLRTTRAVELADPARPQRVLARLVTGAEVVRTGGDEVRARVRTYGPIVLEGIVPGAALEPRPPRGVSLDTSQRVGHEITHDVDLLDGPQGKVVGRAKGGTPVVVEEIQGDTARIVTAGNVRTRAWAPRRAITRLTPTGELFR